MAAESSESMPRSVRTHASRTKCASFFSARSASVARSRSIRRFLSPVSLIGLYELHLANGDRWFGHCRRGERRRSKSWRGSGPTGRGCIGQERRSSGRRFLLPSGRFQGSANGSVFRQVRVVWLPSSHGGVLDSFLVCSKIANPKTRTPGCLSWMQSRCSRRYTQTAISTRSGNR